MTEQITIPQKPDKSTNYIVSRLSYDCLISSTKSFVHNFNSLSDEEKLEFKSLTTYVKQLEKCLPSKQNKPVQKPKVIVPAVETAPASVLEEKVVAPVLPKSSGRTKKVVEPKETSPTAVVVAEVSEETKVGESSKDDSKKATKKSSQSKAK